MSERKPGWYWAKWPHEKKWCVAQYMGRVGERQMWSSGDIIQSDAPREIGPRIPTPDEPWQAVPVEPTPLMASVAEEGKCMTDRELLERAARAAGIEHDGWIDSTRYHRGGLERIEGGGFAFKLWNPLEDDADAFRLMVAIGAIVDARYGNHNTHPNRKVEVMYWMPGGRHQALCVCENAAGSYAAATRRAIVRAAAEMGENK